MPSSHPVERAFLSAPALFRILVLTSNRYGFRAFTLCAYVAVSWWRKDLSFSFIYNKALYIYIIIMSNKLYQWIIYHHSAMISYLYNPPIPIIISPILYGALLYLHLLLLSYLQSMLSTFSLSFWYFIIFILSSFSFLYYYYYLLLWKASRLMSLWVIYEHKMFLSFHGFLSNNNEKLVIICMYVI